MQQVAEAFQDLREIAVRRDWSAADAHAVNRRLYRDELALSRLDVDVVLGKVPTETDLLTAEFDSRCFEVTRHVAKRRRNGRSHLIIVTGHGRNGSPVTEAELGAQRIVDYFKRLGESWVVLGIQDCVAQIEEGGAIPNRVIIKEESARNTEENATNTAAFVAQIRHSMALIRDVEPEHIPASVSVVTQPYHWARMRNRELILPEKSELRTWKGEPGILVRHVSAPYQPILSDDPHTQWLARVYVTAHKYFDALMANLGGLANGLKVVRPAAVEMAMLGLMRLKKLLKGKELLSVGRRDQQLRLVERSLHEALPYVEEILEKVLYLAPEGNCVEQSKWSALAKELGQLVNSEIRWPSDPDRR